MYTYRLPNKVALNIDRLVDCVIARSDFPQTYLDTQTGALIEIPSPESLVIWVTEIGQTNRYLLIERFTDQEYKSIANDFMSEILGPDVNKSKRATLTALVEAGELDEFEEFLRTKTDGWIHAWDQYLHDEAWEYMDDWLTNNPHVAISVEFSGCKDCALCDTLKDGVPSTVTDLLKAFETEQIMQSVRSQLAQKPETEKQKKTDSAFDDKAFVFKVTLKYSHPTIWRRIIIPATATFYELHCAIQDAMGWYDYHMHNFRVNLQNSGNNSSRPRAELTHVIALPSPDLEAYEYDAKDIDERYEFLSNWFGKKIRQCVYTYDFGDNWEHTVLLEKIIPVVDGETYPQCIAGKNQCPPEDCGSYPGYDRIKKILANKEHKEHQEVLEWLGLVSAEEFVPTHFDPKEVVFEDPKDCLQDWERHLGI